MKRYYWLIAVSMLLIASLACGLTGASGQGGSESGSSGSGGSGGSGTGSGSSDHSTKWPLPANVSNFTDTGDDSINFQTSMSLKDTIEFYRQAFQKQGLTEREINTAITDTTFSMVFDGDPNGKAVVIQGVDLGNGTTNVNIRYEDV